MRVAQTVLFASLLFVSCSSPQQNISQNTSLPSPTATAEAARRTPESVKEDPAADSVYTEVSEKACKEIEPEPDSGAIYEAECPGTAGYKLIFSASDHSQVLSVIDKEGKESLLAFRNALNTVADFVMGDKVEWRMDSKGNGAKPRSMIVRLTKFIDPEDQNKTESFLAVIRLEGEPCVTNVVGPSADQNLKARQLADTKGRECLKVDRQ